MKKPFNKLALAVTFSPNARALLKETKRLKDEFNSELLLIHIGKCTPETEEKLNKLLKSSGIESSEAKVIVANGDPADTIIRICSEEKVDLLVAGALEKETFLKYYIGSVARKIMRQAPFSVLILTSPSENPAGLKKFCVEVDFSIDSETTVRKAYDFALLEKAESFSLIREFEVPGVAITIQDSGSMRDTEKMIDNWQMEEESKMAVFVKELNLKGIPVNTICLYGRKGWEASKYADEIRASILVVSAPRKKLRIVDRIFQYDMEFILKKLPPTFLILRN
ncbi:MAG: universal stress protein [Bacillota bacterium]